MCVCRFFQLVLRQPLAEPAVDLVEPVVQVLGIVQHVLVRGFIVTVGPGGQLVPGVLLQRLGIPQDLHEIGERIAAHRFHAADQRGKEVRFRLPAIAELFVRKRVFRVAGVQVVGDLPAAFIGVAALVFRPLTREQQIIERAVHVGDHAVLGQ